MAIELNQIGYTNVGNGKWLAEHDKPFILIALFITNFCAVVLAVLIGIWLAKRNPILLKGVERVIIYSDKNTDTIDTILVMPKAWRKLKKTTATTSDSKLPANSIRVRVNNASYIYVLNSPRYIDLDKKESCKKAYAAAMESN